MKADNVKKPEGSSSRPSAEGSSVLPLMGGYVRKGGHNHNPQSLAVLDRDPTSPAGVHRRRVSLCSDRGAAQ